MAVIDQGQKLQRQLELQARMLGVETDQIKLTQSILQTCVALLNITDNVMPENIPARDFDGIYAGYYGIVNKVNRFCTSCKSRLADRAAAGGRSVNSEEEEKLDQLADELKQAKARLTVDIPAQKADLEKKLTDTRKQIESFQPTMEALMQELAAAEENYAELSANDEILSRIRAGIRAEGFVDIASFDEHLHNLNEQGKQLLGSYNRILKDLSEDVRALQKKIDNQRSPTAR